MANPHRGAVDLQAGERIYTLRLGVNAICELEEATGKGINALAAEMQDPGKVRLRDLRTVLWAALRERHPEITEAEAGEAIETAGFERAVEKIGQAFAAAFPDQAEEPARRAAKKARPRKAGAD